jgi:hypothetical protein
MSGSHRAHMRFSASEFSDIQRRSPGRIDAGQGHRGPRGIACPIGKRRFVRVIMPNAKHAHH